MKRVILHNTWAFMLYEINLIAYQCLSKSGEVYSLVVREYFPNICLTIRRISFAFMFIYFFPWRYSPNLGLGIPPWHSPFHFGFLDLRQLVGLLGRVISSSQGLYLYTNTEKSTHTHTQTLTLNIHALSGIRTHDPGFRASEDSVCLRKLGYRDRPCLFITDTKLLS
jgi:hypothetical protein